MSKITIDRAVVEQVLEAWDGDEIEWFKRAYTVMENLRAALAQEPPELDDPERRCGGPGCDGNCCQPVAQLQQVGWMQKSTGVIRCDWGFDTTGYVPVYAVQEQSE